MLRTTVVCKTVTATHSYDGDFYDHYEKQLLFLSSSMIFIFIRYLVVYSKIMLIGQL